MDTKTDGIETNFTKEQGKEKKHTKHTFVNLSYKVLIKVKYNFPNSMIYALG